MAIIKKYNKQNGTTYVYDSVSYWDKEKQQPRSKRKLIGKIDPVTGEIVPTAGRGRKPKADNSPDEPAANEALAEPVTEETEVPAQDLPADSDYRQLYEDCRRQLLESEAALAKAQSALSSLAAERQQVAEQLEQLSKQLKR